MIVHCLFCSDTIGVFSLIILKLKHPMTYKAMYKSELARAAGVSLHTFATWLIPYNRTLQQMGVGKRAKMLPPVAVRFICETFVIELEQL